MKIKTNEFLITTQEEYELLVEARNLTQRIYEDARESGDLEKIAYQLELALDDLLEYENLEFE